VGPVGYNPTIQRRDPAQTIPPLVVHAAGLRDQSTSPSGPPAARNISFAAVAAAVAGEDDVRRWVLRPRRPQGLRIRPGKQALSPTPAPSPLLHGTCLILSPALASQAVTGQDPPAIRFNDSNLQTFPPSETRGKISGAYRPPNDADGQISAPLLHVPSVFSSDLAR
jgi:hypothetical protein